MLGAITWNPDPIIVEIGAFALRWYSTMFAVGFIISYIVLWFRFKKENVSAELLEKMLIYTVAGTVLGARLGYVIFYEPSMFVERPLEVLLPIRLEPQFEFIGFRGLASHGGITGIIIAFWLLARRTKIPALWYLDKLAIVGAFGGACIRMGNLMNSEILGEQTDLPWGFIFVQHEVAELRTVALHPSQLYEAILYLLLFFFMIWYYNRKFQKAGHGHVLGVFLTLLFIIRFIVEFSKENYTLPETAILNQAQLLSLPFIIGGIALAYIYRKPKPQDADLELPRPEDDEEDEDLNEEEAPKPNKQRKKRK